jgi:hypothetical protein
LYIGTPITMHRRRATVDETVRIVDCRLLHRGALARAWSEGSEALSIQVREGSSASSAHGRLGALLARELRDEAVGQTRRLAPLANAAVDLRCS